MPLSALSISAALRPAFARVDEPSLFLSRRFDCIVRCVVEAGGGMKNTQFDLTGKMVVAHPSRVAQADQIAAAEGIERVVLRALVPPTHAYILDIDKLLELPEDFRV